MIVTFDAEADAIYVAFSDKHVARTVHLDDLRMIDYADDGSVRGIEFVDVSGGIDLREIPFAHKVEAAIRDKGLGLPILV